MFHMVLKSTKIISLRIYIILVFVVDMQCAVGNEICIVFIFGAAAPVGQDRLIHEIFRSHTTTHHSR